MDAEQRKPASWRERSFRLLHATYSYWIQAGPCRIVRSRLRDATPEFGFKVLAVEDFFCGGHHLLHNRY